MGGSGREDAECDRSATEVLQRMIEGEQTCPSFAHVQGLRQVQCRHDNRAPSGKLAHHVEVHRRCAQGDAAFVVPNHAVAGDEAVDVGSAEVPVDIVAVLGRARIARGRAIGVNSASAARTGKFLGCPTNAPAVPSL